MNKILILFFSINLCSYIFAKDINEIYKRCAACHGSKGEVFALGKSIRISNLTKEEFINALIQYKEGKKNESGLGGVMQAQVYTLSKDDFEKLAEIFEKMKKKE